MDERRRPGDWHEDDGEDMLCVCQVCDAHLNADAIGDECPRCGAPVDEAFPLPHPQENADEHA